MMNGYQWIYDDSLDDSHESGQTDHKSHGGQLKDKTTHIEMGMQNVWNQQPDSFWTDYFAFAKAISYKISIFEGFPSKNFTRPKLVEGTAGRHRSIREKNEDLGVTVDGLTEGWPHWGVLRKDTPAGQRKEKCVFSEKRYGSENSML